MQTNHTTDNMTIKFTATDRGNPPGKLADVELHFHGPAPLAGLKLIGFSVWERRGGTGRNVTFPARSYSVNGERRSFALLRPIVDATAHNRIRDGILEAFYEATGDRQAEYVVSACGPSGPARAVLDAIASDLRRGHSSFYTRSCQGDIVVTGAGEGNEGGRRLSTPRSIGAPTPQNALARPICDRPKPTYPAAQ